MGSSEGSVPQVDADGVRRWQVAGGLLVSEGGLLLVQNRRRDGRIDWSPPGGVIDAGEEIQAGLAREIVEETGLAVARWAGFAYRVEVDFADLRMHMVVGSFVAAEWTGELRLEDPDGIVIGAGYHPVDDHEAIAAVLTHSPVWVREPLLEWLAAPTAAAHHRYVAHGTSPGSMRVQRASGT